MKKILFILTIIFLFSCKKEVISNCWVCDVNSVGTIGETIIKQYTNSGIVNKCDMDAYQAIAFEKANSNTTIVNYDAGFGNIQHITVVKTTNCKRK